MQAEVAEAAEPFPGGSSTLPQKHNPVAAALTAAASRRATALAGVLLAAVVAEHERPVGAWHAEWETLSELLTLAGGAAEHAAAVAAGLDVDTTAMRVNLDRIGPILLSERVTMALLPRIGRATAVSVVADAPDFAAALTADRRAGLDLDKVAELLDPDDYLGAAVAWVDRSLAAHQGKVPLP